MLSDSLHCSLMLLIDPADPEWSRSHRYRHSFGSLGDIRPTRNHPIHPNLFLAHFAGVDAETSPASEDLSMLAEHLQQVRSVKWADWEARLQVKHRGTRSFRDVLCFCWHDPKCNALPKHFDLFVAPEILNCVTATISTLPTISPCFSMFFCILPEFQAPFSGIKSWAPAQWDRRWMCPGQHWWRGND